MDVITFCFNNLNLWSVHEITDLLIALLQRQNVGHRGAWPVSNSFDLP